MWTKQSRKSVNYGKNECKAVIKSLTYKLREIQREQSMRQRNLQKKKHLVTSLEKKIVGKKYLRLQSK